MWAGLRRVLAGVSLPSLIGRDEDERFLEVRSADRAVIVRVRRSEIDAETSAGFSRALTALLETAAGRPVVLDFGAVEFGGSPMLAALVLFRRRLAAAGGRLVLCRLRPFVRGTLEISKLDRIFPIRDTVKDALTVVQRPATAQA